MEKEHSEILKSITYNKTILQNKKTQIRALAISLLYNLKCKSGIGFSVREISSGKYYIWFLEDVKLAE